MRLYHFTALHLAPHCLAKGLTLGKIPEIKDGKPGIIPGYQWLTANGNFVQAWEAYSSLPYRRNAVRIELKIPKAHRDKLLRWIEFGRRFKISAILNSFGDPENWYVYHGRIPTGWFRKVVYNEPPVISPGPGAYPRSRYPSLYQADPIDL